MNRRGFFGVLGGATGHSIAVGLPKAMQPEVAKPVATCSVTTHSIGLLERRVFAPDEIATLYSLKTNDKGCAI